MVASAPRCGVLEQELIASHGFSDSRHEDNLSVGAQGSCGKSQPLRCRRKRHAALELRQHRAHHLHSDAGGGSERLLRVVVQLQPVRVAHSRDLRRLGRHADSWSSLSSLSVHSRDPDEFACRMRRRANWISTISMSTIFDCVEIKSASLVLTKNFCEIPLRHTCHAISQKHVIPGQKPRSLEDPPPKCSLMPSSAPSLASTSPTAT